MKKIFTLFALLVLTCTGAWAQTTATYGKGNGTFYDKDGEVYTSGFEGKKFVSNTDPAVTIESSYTGGLNAADAVNGARLGTDGTASDGVTTYTISVPDGCVITGYELQCWAVNADHPAKTFTTEGGDTYDVSSTTAQSISVTGLNQQSTYFTISINSGEGAWSPVKTNNFKIYVQEVIEGAIEVTYQLYDGGALVGEATVEQAANSDASVPSTLTTGYYVPAYDFNYSSETVGDANCTITVDIAPKEGVVTDLATLSNDKVYTLTSRRGSLSTNGSKLTTNTSGTDLKNFAIISYEDKTFLWSEEDGKWVKKDGTFTENVADVAESSQLILTTEGVRNGVKPLFFGGLGDYGINTNAGGHVAANNWTTRDDGNEFVIKENGDFDPTNAVTALDNYFHPSYTINYIVKDENGTTLFTANDVPASAEQHITTLPEAYQQSLFYTYNTVDVTITEAVTTIEFTATQKEGAPFQFTADTSSPVWYNLAIRPDNLVSYLTYVDGGTPNVTLPATLAEDETTQWAFIGSPYDGFQIVNKAAGTDLVLGSASAADDGNSGGNTYATLGTGQKYEVWTITASDKATNGFFMNNALGQYLNRRSTDNLAYWTGGHDIGSTFVATKILADDEKYNELIALLESYELGDNLHQYSVDGYTTEQASETIANLKSEGYTADNMTAAQALADAMTLNMPQANTFLRIKSAHDTYLSGVASTDPKNRMTLTDEADANTIFFFDGNKLLAFGNGYYAEGRDVAAANGESVDYWFEESTKAAGKYAVRFNPDGGTNRFLYAWDASKNYADQNSSDHANCVFTLEAVTELPVTLNEYDCKDGQVRWIATFAAPVAVSSVEGAEIYKTTEKDGYVEAEPANVTGIPAETAVLLVSEEDPGAPVMVFLGETEDAVTTALQPLYACEKGKEGLFLGKIEDSVAGFVALDSETETGGFTGFVADDGNGAKELVFESDATCINSIENGADNGAVFNLQGQRVNKAQKGVYIQNGKKVVLK